MTESGISELVSSMTLREKLGQMSQVSGVHNDNEERIRDGRVGSFLNVNDPETCNRYQRIALQESRLGIPLIIGRDVIHGYRTIFPIPLGQAAAWNPELTRQAARIAAREASACGINWTFAPMVDIARDPRWGRIAEGCGEDPFLASALAAAMVRGFQGDDLGDPESIAACAKHFVGYGAAEGGRDYNTAELSERTLREVYLPSFHACVQAGTATLMSAFNEISGIPASGNPLTLSTILRGEWQFDGFVVSDWNSVCEMVTHGFCADRREAAREAVKAGVDMEMVSTSYSDHLEELVARGEVPIAVIDTAVSRILRIKARLGLFDHPRVDLGRKAVLLSREHLAVARELATQSLVLLKNDGGLLPLRKDLRSIAVIGPLADSPADQMGCWTFDGKPEDVRTPLSAIREAVSAATQVCHAPGLSSDRSSDTSGFEEAVRATRGAEAAVVFVGESAGLSGEAHCRAFLDLPGAQQQLVEAIHATGTPTVVVVMAGRPLTINWVAEHVPAVLMAWHPGTMGGSAIADLLFGDAAPSGKLPVSFPRTVGQIPIHYNHKNTGRPPVKRDRKAPMGTPLDPVGFCSHYLDVDETPQFPFGYGLSFTSFEYSDIQVSPPTIRLGESVQVSAKVANTGARPGVETAQLYVRDLAASVTRPVKELRGFQRVALSPGESRRLEFRLHTDDVRFYDRNMRFVAEPGAFRVWIGTDSDSGVSAEFRVQ